MVELVSVKFKVFYKNTVFIVILHLLFWILQKYDFYIFYSILLQKFDFVQPNEIGWNWIQLNEIQRRTKINFVNYSWENEKKFVQLFFVKNVLFQIFFKIVK